MKRGPGENNFRNFIAAVRSGKRSDLNADILEGHYSSALCHLANASYRLGEEVPFEPRTKAFGDNKEAYETLARPERRALHLSAASFLRERAGIDPDEIADVIATHYRDAYEAAPNADDAAAVRSEALAWLRRAGERSAALAATDDERRSFDAAAELTGDDVERAGLLERAGELAFASDDLEVAVERLEESRALYLAAGRTHDAARAAVPLCTTLWSLGRVDDAFALAEPAFALLAADEPDEDVARLAAEVARLQGAGYTAADASRLAAQAAQRHLIQSAG